ncbi:MAG TPA: biotin/lipoyl-containing protein [Candidatus Binataceae bacterium]|jgi:biotin carboxyl carrier protein|nr:biotin/lipoyl-containing protein [Candidatus Binataceae bacterium]
MRYQAIVDGADHELEIEETSSNIYRVKLGDRTFDVDLRRTHGSSFLALVGNRAFDFSISADGDGLLMISRRGVNRVTLVDKTRRRLQSTGERVITGRVELKAMMPGRVVNVLVKAGDEVAADQGIVVVEAMKMENELKTPKGGKVLEIKVSVGQAVEKGEILAVIE